MGEAPELPEEAWVVPTEVWGATAGTPAVPLGVGTPFELALFPGQVEVQRPPTRDAHAGDQDGCQQEPGYGPD